ncbi:hypothetical protein [Rhodohalobacter mucosus]|uniref:Uroporphyrinogen-III synthase n=1 Tax=Rhodohalobacter mucosus TaxID=2079485 RepID=A0A316TQU1_9BACT|nr:hypothetical protein [Rhodohalobacter mucosus]PWN06780.1 hypothetical protein DDZ15_05770 [Rhodohalobacter mucosus]
MKENILITANRDLASELFAGSADHKNLLHLPLEAYSAETDHEAAVQFTEKPDAFEFVLHGNLLNTRYFMEWVNQEGMLQSLQNRIHLACDAPTASYLESEGIPAILPKRGGKPIDVLEFMLRITKEGASLYPARDGEQEELPALLRELDLPVLEFIVCRERTLSKSELSNYRKRAAKEDFSHILIHNQGSFTRLRTVFPQLNLKKFRIISGSPGVTNRLIEEGLEPVREADGTWVSIRETITDL